MKKFNRFKGHVLQEFYALKPLIYIVLIINVLAVVSFPTFVLIFGKGAFEFNTIIVFNILTFILPAVLNLLFNVLGSLHNFQKDYNIQKRNIQSFSLPATNAEVVLSRIFISNTVNISFFILFSVTLRLSSNLFDYEQFYEIIFTIDLLVFGFSVLYNGIILCMFISPKENLVFTTVTCFLALILGNTAKHWTAGLPEIDSDVFIQNYFNFYPVVLAGFVSLHLLTVLIACRLAGRREKLCAG